MIILVLEKKDNRSYRNTVFCRRGTFCPRLPMRRMNTLVTHSTNSFWLLKTLYTNVRKIPDFTLSFPAKHPVIWPRHDHLGAWNKKKEDINRGYRNAVFHRRGTFRPRLPMRRMNTLVTLSTNSFWLPKTLYTNVRKTS